MSAAAILIATLKFAAWELSVFAASLRIARGLGWASGNWTKERPAAEVWLAVLAIEVTLESSAAALFSFAGWNSAAAYWTVAILCAIACAYWSLRMDGLAGESPAPPQRLGGACFSLPWTFLRSLLAGAGELRRLPMLGNRWIAALAAPLIVLAFRPVEEIDSINYLHYLIDWMANRATPYTFATNYVAFWELSFLPAWTLTRVDLFFPLLAMKAIVLLGLGAWLVGREIGLRGGLLLWTVAGSLAMRHYWYQYSGIPTLKNDALHGVGFVLLVLVVLRATRGKLARTDVALLAFGCAFAAVKYTGVFLIAVAVTVLVVRGLCRTGLLACPALVFLATSGHYYLRSLIQHGNPFYPFQINFGPIHLPGTADLSYTSILHNLNDPRLWKAFFLPAGGVSPAGLLFPAILAATLLLAVARVAGALIRHRASALDWTAGALLCGWLLYFRSMFSASGGHGDLTFILNALNSIRYVDGVLAVSELFLVSLIGPWLAAPLVAINLASRLLMLYLELQPELIVITVVVVLALFLLPRLALVVLLMAGPFLVEWNRTGWTTHWSDLKPAFAEVRADGLSVLAFEDGGYFAGHVVAAGNQVNPDVRAFLPAEIEGMPEAERPRYLAVLVIPGSDIGSHWRESYGGRIARWGYQARAEGKFGAIFERYKLRK